jgi:hypothetical protein
VNSLVRPSLKAIHRGSKQGQKHASVDALSRRPYPKAHIHCPKVEQQSECWQAQIIANAAIDNWDHSALRRDQLCDNDVGPILEEVEAGEYPKRKNINESSPT